MTNQVYFPEVLSDLIFNYADSQDWDDRREEVLAVLVALGYEYTMYEIEAEYQSRL
jgi:hypothetical protein